MNRRGGIKLEGEGEWHAPKYGGTKRRVRRKIHIAIDEKTMEIRAADLTTSDVGDAPMLPELPMLPERLDQIPADQQIACVTADRAFDTRKCHDAIAARYAAALLPPRKNAKPRKPDTPPPAPKPCAPHAAWVEPSGDDGAAITAEAASTF